MDGATALLPTTLETGGQATSPVWWAKKDARLLQDVTQSERVPCPKIHRRPRMSRACRRSTRCTQLRNGARWRRIPRLQGHPHPWSRLHETRRA
uniref:Uncharacterized protein n=1 Tax=Arundo donax TaxID=35708 RepID=A0A0A9GV60_ARUDO